MTLHYRRCLTDADQAKYALYFIRNRTDFDPGTSLTDSFIHILHTIKDSQIVMIENDSGEMAGWGHYRYQQDESEAGSQGISVFVHSVMLAKEYRSTRQFLGGFRHFVSQIAEECPDVEWFQFSAKEDNMYLNRLYAKFAQVIGKQEGYFGTENLYATKFSRLKNYLGV